MPTIRDVATLAGVSTATVSHFINNSRRLTPETHARVEQAIAAIGFVPNPAGRMLAQQKNHLRAAVPPPPPARVAGNGYGSGGPPPAPARLISPALPNFPPGSALVAPAGGTTRLLMKIVRAAQPISRADLARRLGVNRSTVTDIVRPLLDSGVLREGAPEQTGEGRAGRPPIGLSLLAKKALFVGVNIGVRRTQVGATRAGEGHHAEESFDTPSDPGAALARIRSAVEAICAEETSAQQLYVGVSVPGPTDADGTRILYAPHLGWSDVRVAEALGGVRVGGRQMNQNIFIIVENDATAAATYEARRRFRDHASEDLWNDFILVRAGTGVGVGLVLGGEVYRGTGVGGGIAGEFGHMTIVAGGKECACGNRGCWERYASATAAASLYGGDRAPARSASAPRFLDIVGRAEVGERRAQATLARVGEYLGIGIGNVISGLGIPRVVVSGRVVFGWKFIEDPLRSTVARTMAGRLAKWSIVPGEPTGSGLGGALEVAVEQYLATTNGAARQVA